MFLHAYGQGEAKVNVGVEFGHVVVQVELADLGVCGENMLDKRAEVNTVKSFCWIVKDGIVDVIDSGGTLVANDGQYKPAGCPCFEHGDVGGS